jgi:transposase
VSLAPRIRARFSTSLTTNQCGLSAHRCVSYQAKLAHCLRSVLGCMVLEIADNSLAPALLELPGCGAVTAAKLLAEIGPISRFKTDAQLARHSGVAPLEASSGKNQRHRLDRGGNRQLNAALYRIAITQSRYHPCARAYLERKQAEGKMRREAIRCLKRLLARTVFNTLKASPTLT